jgi:hypothetical protein
MGRRTAGRSRPIRSFCKSCAGQLHGEREFHNATLKEYCGRQQVPLADVCSRLRPEHFADELHTNESGAKIIAEEVFKALKTVCNE